MAAKVVLNGRGIAALLKSSEIRGVIRPPAERVLGNAIAGAPVDSGAYKASLHIVSATTDRAVERVTASVFYVLQVEARTGNLARALGSAGG